MTTKIRSIRRPQEFEESKVQGYFMISKQDAAVVITNKLTGSQCRLWLYLMLVDPFADYTPGGEVKYHDLPTIAEIAVAVGSSPDTVEKDLRKLRKLGLYEYRTVTLQGHNLTAARAKAEAEHLSKSKSPKNSPKPSTDKASAYLSSDSAYLSPDSAYLSPDSAYLSPDSAYLSSPQSPEPLPNPDSSAPQNNQIYSNLFKSLSELSKAERENFEKFVRDEWRKITAKNGEPGKEIISLERFLSKPEDLDNWWQKFLKSSAGRQVKKKGATGHDWHKDPRFNEWIWEAFERGYEWVHENEAEREERNLFYDWAFAVNAFEGVCL
ncbi:MAG: hypothetical protein KME30_26245 [Iphinoe sp. HA4291-MV1]|nr:hypothetical protein [Iphinoe sp. HA4291-MV1]